VPFIVTLSINMNNEIYKTPESHLEADSKSKTGFIFLVIVTLTYAVMEVLVQSYQYLSGQLELSKIIRLGLTVIIFYFLWRGSKVAYGLLVFFLAASITFLVFYMVNKYHHFILGLFIYMSILIALLLSKPTRNYLSEKRLGKNA
jgi:hypothetical protein